MYSHSILKNAMKCHNSYTQIDVQFVFTMWIIYYQNQAPSKKGKISFVVPLNANLNLPRTIFFLKVVEVAFMTFKQNFHLFILFLYIYILC